jgi:hypothetical protein
MVNGCDYHAPAVASSGNNCACCKHWTGAKCQIEDKAMRNDKTDIVHETFRTNCRRGLTGMVLK